RARGGDHRAHAAPIDLAGRPGAWPGRPGVARRTESVHYLTDRFRPGERRLIWIAALVLLPVFFFPVLPIWVMKLWAPQYREGLTLTIYTHTIKGDLQSINTLNHYVGMHAITPDDFREFRFLPQALTAFGVLALLAALV